MSTVNSAAATTNHLHSPPIMLNDLLRAIEFSRMSSALNAAPPPSHQRSAMTTAVESSAAPSRATQSLSAPKDQQQPDHKFTVPSKPTATVAGQQQQPSSVASALLAAAVANAQHLSNGRKRPRDDACSSSATTPTTAPNCKELRKTFTLDLSSEERAKKSLNTPDILQLLNTPNFAHVLKTPEVQRLFETGEIEIATPTPIQVLCPTNVTSPQKNYAKGFLDALRAIHQNNNFAAPTPTTVLSPGLAVSAVKDVEQKDHKVSPLARPQPKQQQVVSLPGSSQTSPSAFSPAKPLGAAASSADRSPPTNDALNIAQILQALGKGLSPTQSALSASLLFVLSPQSPAVKSTAHTLTSMINQMNQHNQQPYNFHQQQPQFAATGANGQQGGQQPAYAYNVEHPFDAVQYYQQQQPPPLQQSTAYISNSRPTSSGRSSHQVDTTVQSTPRQQRTALAAVHPPTSARSQSRSLHGGTDNTTEDSNEDDDGEDDDDDGTSSMYSSSVPVHPLDPQRQESFKIERKRERNRLAATKCRQRKLERIGSLQVLVSQEQAIEQCRDAEIQQLKDRIDQVQAMLKVHSDHGCDVDLKVLAVPMMMMPKQRKM